MNICYRSNIERNNLWVKLEQNWDHFFWLTGEIPPSLQKLCDQLIDYFGRQLLRGKCALSFRNRVSSFFITPRLAKLVKVMFSQQAVCPTSGGEGDGQPRHSTCLPPGTRWQHLPISPPTPPGLCIGGHNASYYNAFLSLLSLKGMFILWFTDHIPYNASSWNILLYKIYWVLYFNLHYFLRLLNLVCPKHLKIGWEMSKEFFLTPSDFNCCLNKITFYLAAHDWNVNWVVSTMLEA